MPSGAGIDGWVMLRALLATAFGTVLAAAPAAAQPVTPPRTPGFCRQWLSDRMVAVACDPGKEARHIELRLGAVRSGASPKPGVGLLRGVEPLQPGETLRLRWRHPSSRAVLMVTAAAPRGPHTVVVDLRARPEHVEVTAQAGGGLVVTTPTGVTTVPA